jgi:hypothetical protein
MDYVCATGSSAAVLKSPCEFRQRQPHGITDGFQLQHIDSSLTLFVLADSRLGDAEYFGEFRLSQFRFDSNTAKESEEYFPIVLPLGRESSDALHTFGA